ncbi:MAG: hypothetical protein GC199_10315 [Alphaproteobacteria bacterium]|nr:hypothetical protein [Alphaproteobacteria bacterium]
MKHIETRREGAVAVVRLCTGGIKFMTNPMCEELAGEIASLGADDKVRAVIFTGGIPGVFITHYSVAELIVMGEQARAAGVKPGESDPFNPGAFDQVLANVRAMPKPAIAAINGDCMGGGLEFALHCDVRLAAPGEYRIGLPEAGIAILPGGGGTQMLPRTIPFDRALDHMWRADPVTPARAAALGIVTELVEGDVLAAARERAALYMRRDPRALAHIKRLANAARALPYEEGRRLERNLFLDLLVRDEGIAAMTAYEAGEIAFKTAG